MLRELKINNLALLESLDLLFANHETSPASSSLSVLTGETGAGKSIILQALNLLSGCKASNTWIRTGADSASVEAFFEVHHDRKNLLNDLQGKGFEIDDCLILKRIIHRHGRSRYYINNSMATAALVGSVSESLFSVASQHEHQVLLNPRHHLDFLDSIGELWPLREQYGTLFSLWTDQKTRQHKLQQQIKDRKQRHDLLTFQLQEIKDSAISAAEDTVLAAEKKVLKSSDTLMELGHKSYDILSDTVTGNLGVVRKYVEQMAQYDAGVNEIAEKISGYSYELDDLTLQLNQYLHAIPSDPKRLEEIEARIDQLQKLKRKYGGPQNLLEEVIHYADQVEEELNQLDTMDQRLTEIETQLVATEKDLLSKADSLSESRKKTATKLGKAISSELSALSFTTPHFHVKFEPHEKKLANLSASGLDRVEFMFSANPGEPVKPLAKIASGGELSRLLLGLKCILARRDQVETVIFDEVDAGIGGQAAEDIALKIKELSEHHQVLCITHLPQIAARADEHFRVDKTLRDKRTHTEIFLLDEDARIQELARMLGGTSVTEETLAFARKLLKMGAGKKVK